MISSYNLNQCWLIIIDLFTWGNFTGNAKLSFFKYGLENYTFKIRADLPGANELNATPVSSPEVQGFDPGSSLDGVFNQTMSLQ